MRTTSAPVPPSPPSPSPLARQRRARAERAGLRLLAVVLAGHLAGGFVSAVGGRTRAEAQARPQPLEMRLSTLSAWKLTWLPGIGPAKAAAIVRARPRDGRTWTWEEVEAVPGMGPATIERLRRLHGVVP
jgi:competence protein ComEA